MIRVTVGSATVKLAATDETLKPVGSARSAPARTSQEYVADDLLHAVQRALDAVYGDGRHTELLDQLRREMWKLP